MYNLLRRCASIPKWSPPAPSARAIHSPIGHQLCKLRVTIAREQLYRIGRHDILLVAYSSIPSCLCVTLPSIPLLVFGWSRSWGRPENRKAERFVGWGCMICRNCCFLLSWSVCNCCVLPGNNWMVQLSKVGWGQIFLAGLNTNNVGCISWNTWHYADAIFTWTAWKISCPRIFSIRKGISH